jgi:hypothetical protein
MATPSKTTKQSPKKEGSTTTTPKKKEPAKVTKLALNKTATLPITVTFQGDNVEAKHTKAGYTHALKLDASAHFSLVDSVSLLSSFDPCRSCTANITLVRHPRGTGK